MARESQETPYRPTKRAWVKLWVDEWLGGTTRFELSPAERGVFIDLLAMAGKSRYPGIIAAGRYGENYRGFPLSYLAGILVVGEELLANTIEKCAERGKFLVESLEFDGQECYVIHILGFSKYQSEYLRQRAYQQNPPGDNGGMTAEQAIEYLSNKDIPDIQPGESLEDWRSRVGPQMELGGEVVDLGDVDMGHEDESTKDKSTKIHRYFYKKSCSNCGFFRILKWRPHKEVSLCGRCGKKTFEWDLVAHKTVEELLKTLTDDNVGVDTPLDG